MKLTACACRAEHYQRIARTWWMKPIWTRRLYHCYACDAILLLAPGAVQQRLHQQRHQELQRAFAPTDMLGHELAGRRTHRREKLTGRRMGRREKPA